MLLCMNDVRAAYLQAAREATALIGSPAIAEAWAAESALPGMSVGALASHLARSVLQVEWFLDGPIAGTERPERHSALPRTNDRPHTRRQHHGPRLDRHAKWGIGGERCTIKLQSVPTLS